MNRESGRHGLVAWSSQTAGFTVLEALVAIGIIALLMSLLLPAVQKTRATARSTVCKNNLHQIGLAFQSFHATHGSLPDDFWSLQGLLPYVEQQALAEETRKGSFPEHSPAVYLCPDDPVANALRRRISYCINKGSTVHPWNGMIIDNGDGQTEFRDISDGLSTTALMAECLVSLRNVNPDISTDEARRDPLRYTWATIFEFTPGQELEFVHYTLDPKNRAVAPFGSGLGTDLLGSPERPYSHLIPPNNWAFDTSQTPQGAFQGALPASSPHDGGAHVLLCDGSVRFVSSSIDMHVWWAVGSRNGNDVAEF